MPYVNLKQFPANLGVENRHPPHFTESVIHTDNKPRVTFLLRKNSSTIGGIQAHNVRLLAALSPSFQIQKISWEGPEWGVPFYFPIFYYRATRNGAGLVYCDDAVTSIVGAKVRANSTKKVVAAVHGLDVILPIPWYQKKLRSALARIDKIICVSRATAERVRERGVPHERIEVIPGAVEKNPKRFPRNAGLYRRIASFLEADLSGKKVLVSVGRCVRRKGFDRFITEVFHHLPEDYIYIIVSPKPSTPAWIKAFHPLMGKRMHHNLLLASGAYTMQDDLIRLTRNHPRIFYLNNVSEDQRDMLLSAGDLFIMPNRTVEGDMEGFGLVAIEAASRGLPVIATAIEGITDAVIDGRNGQCIAEGDNKALIHAITGLLENPTKLMELSREAAAFTSTNFSPDRIFGRYKGIFSELLSPDGHRG